MSFPKLPNTANVIRFDNSYARLPEAFYTRTPPTPVSQPVLHRLNRGLCEELGIDAEALTTEQWAQVLGGNVLLPGSEPLAMAYAGHQFGHFVPRLGDGRAVLLGETMDAEGQRYDIHLKGSGPTPFSRAGDGRAALGPVLREYLVSEAMHALGVPTSRALAAVGTGEVVYREERLPGAVLTRVAHSHIRVGTFQYFAMGGDQDSLKLLADHVIARHAPDLAEAPEPYWALLSWAIERQARLVAHWMSLGFIHGVMNTDNMAISGQTIDYGPCAFMDHYHPNTVFSAIDQRGRYAFANQPEMAQWNLARFAECVLPLGGMESDEAVERAVALLQAFSQQIEQLWLERMIAKLGMRTEEANDLTLLRELLEIMARESVDYTLFFRLLSHLPVSPDKRPELRALCEHPAAIDNWLSLWETRLSRETQDPDELSRRLCAINPAVIPRNHQVEKALNAAIYEADFAVFEQLLAVITQPFTETAEHASYMQPPKPEERVLNTFCGT
ncbi:Uncharacterized conserved protein YdiU, UPF0061 family [Ectothiorhodosinus mongolicus]|uniref:Protein nucleotidyltransferase YdiU n=1 Tax=Ectothiorhodosinus mongolicus TaxID=233100 RepID=A0A1R3VQB4_9GAMM|nr:YdiU family protein [Ectothiorhodosinus mongolicus]ULX56249.1 SELO family protein [Ectothiorhodosinus mongolicus]SIT65753.1 Uncharacterized conserved protein YdiU, UPF0061 family [Ectothiorhodosinus mongolicus]